MVTLTERETTLGNYQKQWQTKMEGIPRKTGVDIIGEVPWGTHLCQFYETKENLIEILVPYFKAGLENNEFCMWVTSEPLNAEEAKLVLGKAIKNLDDYIRNGQIEILDYTEWYTKSGRFNADEVLQGWVEKENEALRRGFDGLRLTGNTFWLEEKDWRNFADYEEVVNSVIGEHRMLAICSYSLDKCGVSELIDVVKNHQVAIIKREGNWECIESSTVRQNERALADANARLQALQQITATVHKSLDMGEVFREITKGAISCFGYTTAVVLVLNKENNCYEVQAFDTKKPLLPLINKLLRYPLQSLTVPAQPDLNPFIASIIGGSTEITSKLTEVLYPLISKKACYALQKLAHTKNYVVVPLPAEAGVIGAIFISSPYDEVSEQELTTLRDFARSASQAIANADLYARTKQAEVAFRQSEKTLQVYLDNAPDGVYLNDLKGTFLYGNKRAEEITGYEKEELIGNNFLKLNLLPAKHFAKAGKLLALNAMGRPTGPDEFELIRKDGSHVCVEITTAPIQQDGNTVVIGFVRDISERKQAEDLLRKSEKQASAAIEAARALTFNYNIATGKVTWGGAIEEITGHTREEFAKVAIDGWAERIHPDDRDRILSIFQEATGKDRATAEYRFKTKKGYVTLSSISITEEQDGKAVRLIGILQDITERKQAEERERQLQQELNLSSRLASIGEMASGIAHEINNPLTSVIGFSQLLMSRGVADDVKSDLEVINSQSQRVAKIVAGLLAFARQQKPGKKPADINSILMQVLKLRSYEMEVNNIEVLTQLATDLPLTIADAGQLQQVFLNIIINAEKEMTRGHNRGRLIVKTEKKNDVISISFTDDGPGIDKENLDKIFDPFFTTKEVGEGTGLGLSISHGVITSHKGRICAKSKPGQGATFIIELPIVADTEQAEDAEVVEAETWQGRGSKILVVDDETTILDFLECLLTDEGYEVDTVDRANAALEKIDSQKYDLILMDIKLPGMNGIELYHHIKATDPALVDRIVFITGDVMETTTREFLAATKATHISKPIDIERLKKEVNSVLTKNLELQRHLGGVA